MGAQPPDDKENQPPPRRNAPAGARPLGARMALEQKKAAPDERLSLEDQRLFLVREDDARRLALVQAAKRDHKSPDRWLALLQCPPSVDADFTAMRKLLWRVKFLLSGRRQQLKDDPSYALLCILFAKIAERVENVRRGYQAMLDEGIGLKEPLFYEEFAALERREGNIDAMEDILSRGVANRAYNDAEREAMRKRVNSGTLASAGVLPILPPAPKFQESQRDRPATNGFSTPLRSTKPYQPTTASLVFTPALASKIDPSVVSTTSKIPPSSNSNSGMTTPTMSNRAPPKSQSTTRKSSLNTSRTLGISKLIGGPMRVVASEYDDSSDDDEGMMDLSQQPEEMKSTPSPSPPTKEEPKPEKFVPSDLDYLRNWKSRDEEAKSASVIRSTTKEAAVSRQLPELTSRTHQSTHTNFRTPRRQLENGSSRQLQTQTPAPSSLLSARKLSESTAPSSGVRFGASSNAYDHARSPKRLQVDAGIPLRRDADNSPFSASSVSSASSPPLINAGPNSQTPLDPFGSLKSKVVVKGSTYIKLEQIGSGGSSKVYRMLGPDLKIYALKKIKLKRLDEKSIKQYTNEIELLEHLQGNPHIIQLVAAEPDPSQRQINVIMEHGEIDLNDRLRDLKDGMDENFLRVIWTQMLQAVHAIHSQRIIHGDLKPANFLFVNGTLKLIDFGIAKAISNDTTNIERDSQVGTVNYMSPEAIQGNSTPGGQRNPQGKMKVGRASDIWSLGCILYQIVYGKPPFADVHSIIEKFRCIIDPSVSIPIPSLKNKDLEDVIRSCLQRDHRARPPIDGENGLLRHPFLRSSGATDPTPHVTVENAPQVLSELVQFFRAKGLDTSSLSTFQSIGERVLRLQRPSSASPRIGYNTQERRTEI